MRTLKLQALSVASEVRASLARIEARSQGEWNLRVLSEFELFQLRALMLKAADHAEHGAVDVVAADLETLQRLWLDSQSASDGPYRFDRLNAQERAMFEQIQERACRRMR
jgi:hypothetical protein